MLNNYCPNISPSFLYFSCGFLRKKNYFPFNILVISIIYFLYRSSSMIWWMTLVKNTFKVLYIQEFLTHFT